MEDLRRIKVGKIDERSASRFDIVLRAIMCYKKGDVSLLNRIVMSMEEMFSITMPKIVIKANAAINLCSGAQLMRPGVIGWSNFKEGDYVAYFSKNRFVGIGKAEIDSKELRRMKKGLVARTVRMRWSKSEARSNLLKNGG